MSIDRFFDTIEKRRCALFLFVAFMFILAAIQTLLLGSALFQIQSYQQLFDILKTDVLSISYVSRCIYSMISLASMSPLDGILILVQNLHFFEISLLLILVVFLLSQSPKKNKRYIWASILAFFIVIIACICCVIKGIQANSLQDVIQQLQWIGILFMIQGGFQIICCLAGIYRCVMQDYLPAMRVEVIYWEDEK